MLLSLAVTSHKKSPAPLEHFLKKFGEQGPHANPQIVKYWLIPITFKISSRIVQVVPNSYQVNQSFKMLHFL